MEELRQVLELVFAAVQELLLLLVAPPGPRDPFDLVDGLAHDGDHQIHHDEDDNDAEEEEDVELVPPLDEEEVPLDALVEADDPEAPDATASTSDAVSQAANKAALAASNINLFMSSPR